MENARLAATKFIKLRRYYENKTNNSFGYNNTYVPIYYESTMMIF